MMAARQVFGRMLRRLKSWCDIRPAIQPWPFYEDIELELERQARLLEESSRA